MQVEIWSDFSCPFCFIGKRNFERALAEFPHRAEVKVIYKSFELDTMAAKSQKVSIYQILAKKYGKSIEWAKQSNENVKLMGKTCGIELNIEKVIPTNSFTAHRLSHLAKQRNIQAQVMDPLFEAYFRLGLDIADPVVLQKIGEALGLSAEIVAETLNSNEFSTEVREDEQEASELGIQGVPFFVFDRKLAVSGAQTIEVFKQALQQVSQGSF